MAPIPSIAIIIPNWDTVENASIPFKSCCFVAFSEAQNNVIKPTSVTVHTQPCDAAKIGVIRAIKYNPALTIVAE